MDFGYRNPFSCQWWAMDGDGRMYLYREIYMTNRTVAVHAELINRLSVGENIYATISDHDAEDRATLEENGIYTDAADKSVSAGIQRVQERLKVQGDGKPRLFIFRGCLVETDTALEEAKKPTSVVQEFDGYVWNDKAVKDAPVKQDDHGLDALRYAAAWADNPRLTGGIYV